ncbi:SDR family oxidoreductase [bacterium]|jgi:NAD(P)-dependent dehydrogenase (short-subunit alcohol dehydrogenase family)|nr:SDR family oxidoreductase [bacterium]
MVKKVESVVQSFKDNVVIVTGAGKGIGRATAIELAHRGAKVIAMARTLSDLESLNTQIASSSIDVDLSNANDARLAMKAATGADFLVNCAGTNVLQNILDMTDDAYETIMNVNLRAALICSQEFARDRVRLGGGGAIVNVSSIAGQRGFADHLVYAASKAGLDGATRVMAKELGAYGIRVNAVAPTITMTDLAAEAWSDPAKKDPMMVRHPLGRFAEVEDVAKTIIALLSGDVPAVTGSVIPIDCGFLGV